MSQESVGFICGIFHPKLDPKSKLKEWKFREDELDDIHKQFLGKPVLWEHEGDPIGRVEEIRMADWGEELLCYLDIHASGEFVMNMLENGMVLGLSVGYDSYKLGKHRIGKFRGEEISITQSPAYDDAWIVCNYSKGEFRISEKGVGILTQNPKKKLVKSQIKMSEFKTGKEMLEAQGMEKNASQLDVETIRQELEKAKREAESAKKEAERYKTTYKAAFDSTVKPELDQLLKDIGDWVSEGYVQEEAANALKLFVSSPATLGGENIIPEKLSKIRATASFGGTIKRLKTELEQEKNERQKLLKVVEENAKKPPGLHDEVAGTAAQAQEEQKKAQQMTSDLKAWDNFIQAKASGKPDSYYTIPAITTEDVGRALEEELARAGFA